MSLDILTNPYVLGYLAVLALLFRAGFGLKKMHEENVERRKHRLDV
jgi:hypothetical protein